MKIPGLVAEHLEFRQSWYANVGLGVHILFSIALAVGLLTCIARNSFRDAWFATRRWFRTLFGLPSKAERVAIAAREALVAHRDASDAILRASDSARRVCDGAHDAVRGPVSMVMDVTAYVASITFPLAMTIAVFAVIRMIYERYMKSASKGRRRRSKIRHRRRKKNVDATPVLPQPHDTDSSADQAEDATSESDSDDEDADDDDAEEKEGFSERDFFSTFEALAGLCMIPLVAAYGFKFVAQLWSAVKSLSDMTKKIVTGVHLYTSVFGKSHVLPVHFVEGAGEATDELSSKLRAALEAQVNLAAEGSSSSPSPLLSPQEQEEKDVNEALEAASGPSSVPASASSSASSSSSSSPLPPHVIRTYLTPRAVWTKDARIAALSALELPFSDENAEAVDKCIDVLREEARANGRPELLTVEEVVLRMRVSAHVWHVAPAASRGPYKFCDIPIASGPAAPFGQGLEVVKTQWWHCEECHSCYCPHAWRGVQRTAVAYPFVKESDISKASITYAQNVLLNQVERCAVRVGREGLGKSEMGLVSRLRLEIANAVRENPAILPAVVMLVFVLLLLLMRYIYHLRIASRYKERVNPTTVFRRSSDGVYKLAPAAFDDDARAPSPLTEVKEDANGSRNKSKSQYRSKRKPWIDYDGDGNPVSKSNVYYQDETGRMERRAGRRAARGPGLHQLIARTTGDMDPFHDDRGGERTECAVSDDKCVSLFGHKNVFEPVARDTVVKQLERKECVVVQLPLGYQFSACRPNSDGICPKVAAQTAAVRTDIATHTETGSQTSPTLLPLPLEKTECARSCAHSSSQLSGIRNPLVHDGPTPALDDLTWQNRALQAEIALLKCQRDLEYTTAQESASRKPGSRREKAAIKQRKRAADAQEAVASSLADVVAHTRKHALSGRAKAKGGLDGTIAAMEQRLKALEGPTSGVTQKESHINGAPLTMRANLLKSIGLAFCGAARTQALRIWNGVVVPAHVFKDGGLPTVRVVFKPNEEFIEIELSVNDPRMVAIANDTLYFPTPQLLSVPAAKTATVGPAYLTQHDSARVSLYAWRSQDHLKRGECSYSVGEILTLSSLVEASERATYTCDSEPGFCAGPVVNVHGKVIGFHNATVGGKHNVFIPITEGVRQHANPIGPVTSVPAPAPSSAPTLPSSSSSPSVSSN